MSTEDQYVSRGPVSSLPGSSHTLEEGAKCDRHDDRLAVSRVQGETDSFGCEYLHMCQECLDELRAFNAEEAKKERFCDWHKGLGLNVRARRDPDEGSYGPVYQVCEACRKASAERICAELAEQPYEPYDPYWLDGDEDDYEYGDGYPSLFGDAEEEPPKAPTSIAQPPVVTYKRARKIRSFTNT